MIAERIRALNWSSILSIFIAFLLSFYLLSFLKFSSFNPLNSTDSSWQYSLSGLRHSSQQLGDDIYYTYGPLFVSMPTYIHANDSVANFVIGNIFFIYLLFINTLIFWKFGELTMKKFSASVRSLMIVAATTITLTLTDLDTAFNIILLITIFVARNEKRYLLKLLILSAVYLLSFYKFSYLLPAAMLTPLVFIQDFDLKGIARGLVKSFGALLVCISIFFILVKSISILGFIKFIYYSLVNTAYYGEFMGLPYDYEGFLPIVIVFIAVFYSTVLMFLAKSALLIKNNGLQKDFVKNYLVLGFAFLVVAFFDYKHAVVRNDIHLLSFTPFVFLCGAFILASVFYENGITKHYISRLFIPAIFLSIVSIFGHVLILALLTKSTMPAAIKSYNKYLYSFLEQSTVNNRFNFGTFSEARESSRESIKMREQELSGIKSQLDAHSSANMPLLFYGNTNLYGEIINDKRQVLYSPFLQNYVAYPPSLGDKLYISFLEQHPNSLVFAEENEASIDTRIPAHELSNFFQYLIHNYKIIMLDKEKKHYVFERVSNNKENCRAFAKISFLDNARTPLPPLPQVNEYEYIKLKLDSNHNIYETIASAAIKNPVYTMTLFTPEGATMDVRTTKTTLEHGIAIQPFNQSFRDFITKQPFSLGTFALHDGLPTASNYTANLEMCSFRQ